jgi:hypothetical protein
MLSSSANMGGQGMKKVAICSHQPQRGEAFAVNFRLAFGDWLFVLALFFQ